jgi:hypothetical protein
VNTHLEMIRKDVEVACFKVLARQLSGETGERHENLCGFRG